MGVLVGVLSLLCLSTVSGYRQKHASKVKDEWIHESWGDDDESCDKLVKGSVLRKSAWRRVHECKCPKNTVISGENPVCKKKWDNYDRYFDNDDEAFLALGPAECECKHRPGCGIVSYTAEQVLPADAAAAGLPTPVMIGTPENINTGVVELDRQFYGLWWMKDNPVPEELASMAGAFSRLTGTGPDGGSVPLDQVDWKPNLTVGVPNSRHNRWSWPDTWAAKTAIMPSYTSALDRANNFTMYNTTYGEIETNLKTMPLVWVDIWELKKLDEHTWLRTTKFQKGSLLSTNYYTLTRIADEHGEATPHFQVFKDYMAKNQSGADLLVWDTDDTCKRKCMLDGGDCTKCHAKCTAN